MSTATGSTVLAALPADGDSSKWTDREKALVEAAGLVHTDARSGERTYADRATVEAFLYQCRRTGLDPVGRQIYCIARKSKGVLRWQTQVSIDGARLVAERSGKYEGQTTPEFTGDGETWTQVWLGPGFPKAARVGVYRLGFRDPLYVVALWDAYVQTTYNGEVTDMWRRMGPLMLAKCCEMLALRKAFPQDLSGLYSSEEMSQADGVAGASAARPGAARGDRQVDEAATRQQTATEPEPEAVAGDDGVVDAEIVDDPADTAEAAVEARAAVLDPDMEAAAAADASALWKKAKKAADRTTLRGHYLEAQAAGLLASPVEDGVTLEAAIIRLVPSLPERKS